MRSLSTFRVNSFEDDKYSLQVQELEEAKEEEYESRQSSKEGGRASKRGPFPAAKVVAAMAPPVKSKRALSF